jgi:hypothetical protein
LIVAELLFNDFSDELTTVNNQRFLDSATGPRLEKLAREVGVTRETGETDDELRFRTKIARTAARSNGTFGDIAAVLSTLFDAPERITVSTVTNEPALSLAIPQEMIDGIALSKSQLQTELESIVPAGDGIQITTSEDFAFAGTSSGKGFDDGNWA